MNKPSVKLGNLLFNTRIENGLSLRDFCEELGISHAYLSKLEKGIDPRTGKDVTPTIETLVKIADGIGISLDELLMKCGYLEPATDVAPVLRLELLISGVIDEVFSVEAIEFKNEGLVSRDRALALAAQMLLDARTEKGLPPQ